ncbi:MAG: hypothetical protein LBT86_10815, partial [Deltaproteobacteria bacterium]|nr:hypothetical protein [Deltaproteobacteria bacterium]
KFFNSLILVLFFYLISLNRSFREAIKYGSSRKLSGAFLVGHQFRQAIGGHVGVSGPRIKF